MSACETCGGSGTLLCWDDVLSAAAMLRQEFPDELVDLTERQVRGIACCAIAPYITTPCPDCGTADGQQSHSREDG